MLLAAMLLITQSDTSMDDAPTGGTPNFAVPSDSSYRLEPIAPDNYTDKKIVSGKRKVVVIVPSVDARIDELSNPAVGVNPLSFPAGSSKLYLYTLTDGECCIRNLYEYDINLDQFKVLTSTNHLPVAGEFHLSPDGLRFASVVNRNTSSEDLGRDLDEKILYIVDLYQDSATEIVRLTKENETLTEWCTLGCGESIAWLDDSTIQYGVYNLKSQYPDQKDLIEKRVITIPSR